MIKKLTEWFPADVKPVHVGWYHTRSGGTSAAGSPWNWWWSGKYWLAEPGAEEGHKCVNQNRIWRGLAEKP